MLAINNVINKFFVALVVQSLSIPVHADRIVKPFESESSSWPQQHDLVITNSPAEAMTAGYVLVIGKGLPVESASAAKRQLTALRAAEVMAYRRLAEIINGVHVTGHTTVKDCALESDTVKNAVSGLIKGARKLHEKWDQEQGMAIVIMQVGMHGADSVADTIYDSFINSTHGRNALRVSSNSTLTFLQQTLPTLSANQSNAIKTEYEDSYDGLIVDARNFSFQPALINRLFNTKGEAVYDPSKVSQKILVEQGAGEYSNTIEKARAALTKRGSKLPLIVTPSGLKSMSDLNLNDDDILSILRADQKSNFLALARVAFVLK